RRRHTRSTRDWSSDVCSSDLNRTHRRRNRKAQYQTFEKETQVHSARNVVQVVVEFLELHVVYRVEYAPAGGARGEVRAAPRHAQIGRASCRERVWIAEWGRGV